MVLLPNHFNYKMLKGRLLFDFFFDRLLFVFLLNVELEILQTMKPQRVGHCAMPWGQCTRPHTHIFPLSAVIIKESAGKSDVLFLSSGPKQLQVRG